MIWPILAFLGTLNSSTQITTKTFCHHYPIVILLDEEIHSFFISSTNWSPQLSNNRKSLILSPQARTQKSELISITSKSQNKILLKEANCKKLTMIDLTR